MWQDSEDVSDDNAGSVSSLRRSGRAPSSVKKASSLKGRNSQSAFADKTTIDETSDDEPYLDSTEPAHPKGLNAFRGSESSKRVAKAAQSSSDSDENSDEEEIKDAAALRALEACSVLGLGKDKQEKQREERKIKK